MKKPRTDATRNRERIIAAARELFAKSAEPVAMDTVRRKAGVGRATFYRNFDDIDSLAAAIFEENLAALERRLSSGTFEDVLLVTVEEGLSVRAMLPALASRASSPEIQMLAARVTKLLARALKVAKARGEVRADLDARDVLQLLAMIFATILVDPSTKGLQARVRRAMSFVLDGIRPR
ncbi:MAG: helix-turn-helix domain-containing protein [Archangium sp.]